MNDPKPKLAKPAGAPASTTASERVRERIQAAGRRFHANDNIAEFIQGEAELKELEQEVTGKLQGLLESLVIDTEGDHNTRHRAAGGADFPARGVQGPLSRDAAGHRVPERG